MVHILESLNPQDNAPTDLRERLLATAFAWLETTDDDSLHHILPASELAAVSDKAGRIAAKLNFGSLDKLFGQTRRGFHLLMSLDAFLPSLTAMEGLLKVNKYVTICNTYIYTVIPRAVIAHTYNMIYSSFLF